MTEGTNLLVEGKSAPGLGSGFYTEGIVWTLADNAPRSNEHHHPRGRFILC
jgi:hypothetical protein